jgi:hypothetical protein
MKTKLTLRMEETLVSEAKTHAMNRGKSVSQLFGDFVKALNESPSPESLPPVTRSLVGVMKGQPVDEADYKEHLRRKYL